MDIWNKIKTVEKMQNYIEKHISEPISLHMLAREAGYSPWYAARIFKELTGKAPFLVYQVVEIDHGCRETRGMKISKLLMLL